MELSLRSIGKTIAELTIITEEGEEIVNDLANMEGKIDEGFIENLIVIARECAEFNRTDNESFLEMVKEVV